MQRVPELDEHGDERGSARGRHPQDGDPEDGSGSGWLVLTGLIGAGGTLLQHLKEHQLHAGVEKVHFIDGRVPHTVLLEIFTEQGIGTQIRN